jgi:2-oxoglutarate ferredoxin oxidoreductase subunit alpha
MNERLCAPLQWDDARQLDRGKVMTAEELEAGKTFGRYLDVDGDGIPYRTYPGTHPTRGAFFTRGTSKDRYAKYSEEGSVYADNMRRLLKKFETAKSYLPKPAITPAKQPTRVGVLYYGSTSPAMLEAVEILGAQGVALDLCRVRGFPFHDDVADFIAAHERLFVVEQNRDGQLRTLVINECSIDPAKLTPILHFDGTPITARFISGAIAQCLGALNLTPMLKVVS